MGDESKVVPGTEVVFEGDTLLADQATSPVIVTPDIQEIMRQYVYQVIRVAQKEDEKIPEAFRSNYGSLKYNPGETEHFIPHLRFNSNFDPRINPTISDHDLLVILEKADQKLAALVEKLGIYAEVKKDLSQNCVGDVQWECAAACLNPVGITLINLSEELDRFQLGHVYYLTIPNEYFLSLFIEEGETYRQFLRFCNVPEDQEDPFYYATTSEGGELLVARFSDRKHDYSPPAVSAREVRQKSLEQFITSENGKRVRTFLTDLNNFREELTLGYGKDFHHRWSSWSNVFKGKDSYGQEDTKTDAEREASALTLRSILYTRLQKYHPELTI